MSRGLAVHIGLDHVDPRAYEGWAGRLDAAENDATAMRDLLRDAGFRSRTLLSTDATVAAVFAAISTAARALVSGDICVITYAGHGGQFTDLSLDEADGRDETWLLYDREVYDDEINVALAEFAAGVRVVVVSDSCHSGTVVRAFYQRAFVDSAEVRSAYARLSAGRSGRSRTRSGGKSRMRAAPEDVQRAVLARHRDDYARIRARTPPPSAVRKSASTILLAGCQDNQVSMESDGHGVFTAALLDQWAGGPYTGSYRTLHAAIRDSLPPTQSPAFFVDGPPWPDFERQAPFTVPAPTAPTAPTAPAGEIPAGESPTEVPTSTPRTSYRVELSVEGDAADAHDPVVKSVLEAIERSRRTP